MSEIVKIEHIWTGVGQGINSGLCDCNYHGEIISSRCQCGEFHSWCEKCWNQ